MMQKNIDGIAVDMTPEEIAEWEATRPIFVPPVEGLPNLEPYQFHALVALTGYTADIEAAINADPDPTFKAAAWAKYRYSTYYKRADPFVVALGAAVGLTPEQLDALWLDATGF